MSVLSDSNGTEWVMKNDTSNSDVAMSSYIGAKMCDLVGIYILFDLSSVSILLSSNLYRDV